MVLAWGKFFFLLLLVYLFGTRLTRSADRIAEKKGLARAFMGVVFISMITSFPELFTGISASFIVKSPDLAVGEIIGSCIFNLFIVALIDGFFRKRSIYRHNVSENILPLGFSFIMISLLTFALSTRLRFSIMHIGFYSVLLLVCYLILLRIVFQERKPSQAGAADSGIRVSREILNFIISGAVIIAVGTYLPVVGKELALAMSWQESFVGTIFLAFVTSFPELIVSISTARMGAFDMCLGNIAGSNLFNVGIVFMIDAVYLEGDILSRVSEGQVTVGIIAMMMNFIVFFAVVRGSRKRLFNLISVNALLLFLLFALTFLVLA